MDNYDKNFYNVYKSNFRIRKIGDKPYLYHYFTRFLKNNLTKDSRILDSGCGLGYGLIRLVKYFD